MQEELHPGDVAEANGILTRTAVRPQLLIAAAVVLFAADRWLKGLVLSAGDGVIGLRLWGLPLDFRLFENRDLAFSLPMPAWLFWPAALMVVAVLAYTLRHSFRTRANMAVALAFVALGGFSNLLDRAAFGFVVDYLIIFGLSAVNLADGMIIGGIAAVLILSRRRR